MREKLYFPDMTADAYRHPDEVSLHQKIVGSFAVKKLITNLAELGNISMNTVVEANYIEVTSITARELFEILEEVCETLCYPYDTPRLFVCHKQTLFVKPYGIENPVLLISDYLIETADRGMLEYMFGNAISMVMAGQVELATVMINMPGHLYTMPVRAALLKYLHAADATSDRGGLLACQSYAAAARCQLYEMGITPEQSRQMFTTDAEAVDCVWKCLTEAMRIRDDNSNVLSWVAREAMRLTYVEAEGLDMLNDLYTWYTQEYQQVLKQYGKRRPI